MSFMAWYPLAVVAVTKLAMSNHHLGRLHRRSLLLLLFQSLQLHFRLVRLRPPGRFSLSSAPTLWLCLVQTISAESSQCFIPPVPSGASHVRRPNALHAKAATASHNRWLPLKGRRGLLYIHSPKEAFLTFPGIASLRLLLCFCTFSTTIAPVTRHLSKALSSAFVPASPTQQPRLCIHS